MGVCLQAVHTFKSGIVGGAFEALAAGTGDSLAIPNFTGGSRGWLLEVWADDSVGVAEFDIHSPNFHDNTRGIRFSYLPKAAAAFPQIVMPIYGKQPLYPSDALIAEVNGTAADKVSLDWLAYFEDLPGSDQRLISWAEAEARGQDMVGIRINPIAGAAGDYGAAVAINSVDDRLKANTDYAILGATSQKTLDILTFTAPETSGRRIGMPIRMNSEDNAGFFVDISNRYGLPLIPVINSNNKGNVQFQSADAVAATNAVVDVLLMELG